MEHINKNEYLLPAFQREFARKSEQIGKLFDSLMCGYPTSSMLFWKVQDSKKLSGSSMSLLINLFWMPKTIQ